MENKWIRILFNFGDEFRKTTYQTATHAGEKTYVGAVPHPPQFICRDDNDRMIRGNVKKLVEPKEGMYVIILNGVAYVGQSVNVYDRLETHLRQILNSTKNISDEEKYEYFRNLIGAKNTLDLWVFYQDKDFHNQFERRLYYCLPYPTLNKAPVGVDGRKRFLMTDEYEEVLEEFASITGLTEVLKDEIDLSKVFKTKDREQYVKNLKKQLELHRAKEYKMERADVKLASLIEWTEQLKTSTAKANHQAKFDYIELELQKRGY